MSKAIKKVKIAVLVSGGGTNLQALIDCQRSGKIKSGEIVLVISGNEDAYAIKRAEDALIPVEVVDRKRCKSQQHFEDEIQNQLKRYNVELVVLAGFMNILSESFTKLYNKRIINVHPSLIPSFCGKGYYGLKVHQAALKYGVKVTGATIHYVNEIPDGGEIILQKAVSVNKDDTAQTLQQRVLEQAEWEILPQGVEMVCKEIIKKEGKKVE